MDDFRVEIGVIQLLCRVARLLLNTKQLCKKETHCVVKQIKSYKTMSVPFLFLPLTVS